jgi:hypothetical protein
MILSTGILHFFQQKFEGLSVVGSIKERRLHYQEMATSLYSLTFAMDAKKKPWTWKVNDFANVQIVMRRSRANDLIAVLG